MIYIWLLHSRVTSLFMSSKFSKWKVGSETAGVTTIPLVTYVDMTVLRVAYELSVIGTFYLCFIKKFNYVCAVMTVVFKPEKLWFLTAQKTAFSGFKWPRF